jgi:hypothetical protein
VKAPEGRQTGPGGRKTVFEGSSEPASQNAFPERSHPSHCLHERCGRIEEVGPNNAINGTSAARGSNQRNGTSAARALPAVISTERTVTE